MKRKGVQTWFLLCWENQPVKIKPVLIQMSQFVPQKQKHCPNWTKCWEFPDGTPNNWKKLFKYISNSCKVTYLSTCLLKNLQKIVSDNFEIISQHWNLVSDSKPSWGWNGIQDCQQVACRQRHNCWCDYSKREEIWNLHQSPQLHARVCLMGWGQSW